MANETNFKQLYEDTLDEKQSLVRALISVVLSVGGSIEVSDEVVSSVTSKDRVVTEPVPDKGTHLVWIEREGGIRH